MSELWFNPDAIGSGWFPQRGYLSEKVQGYPGDTVPVEAWMSMPAYEPSGAGVP